MLKTSVLYRKGTTVAVETFRRIKVISAFLAIAVEGNIFFINVWV